VTKFEQKSFSTSANSQVFRDNWDDVFNPQPDPLCSQCRKPRAMNEYPKGFCTVECERAFYEALGDVVRFNPDGTLA
jgi:hypothetical protein